MHFAMSSLGQSAGTAAPQPPNMPALQSLVATVQAQTATTVTESLLEMLQRLALAKSTPDFVRAAKMVAKFHDRDAFLAQLHGILRQGPPGVAPNGATRPKGPGIRSKRKVLVSFDDSEEEEEAGEIVPREERANPFLRGSHTDSRVTFKRIGKDTARKLKQFSVPGPGAAENKPRDAFPEKKPAPTVHSTAAKDHDDSEEQEEEEELPLVNSLPTAEEDKEWYNYDDDPGNIATEEVHAIKDLDFADSSIPHMQVRESFDALHAQVQVFPLPITTRKQWLPPFLLQYSKSQNVSDAAIVGSLADSSNEGLLNPFKNPESQFSKNARLGSKTVNIRRISKNQSQKNKQNTQLANTAMGQTLGVTLPNAHDKNSNNAIGQRNTTAHEQSASEIKESMQHIQRQRRSLPAYQAKPELISMISNNQVSIIIGETGSGKTTQLAQFLYEEGFCSDGHLIGVTQPRRVAAMSVAKRVATEMGVKLGEEVGYSIRFEDHTSPKTLIKFMTDGILLRETLLDTFLSKYNCIIIDEAHERSLNTDILLGIFKTVLMRRKDIKLIITSATMNAAKFSKFFGNAPQFTIPGRTFPVQINYSKSPVVDYVESAMREATRIHLSTSIESGDILIFMTGQEDIEATVDLIKERLVEVYSKKNGISTFDEINDIEIFPIYSALPPNIQNRIFQKLDISRRKIVIATNIAETSLTIDGIKYVIDSGYSKLKVFNPKIGLDSLAITPIALANANQRSGRAGRTGPGVTYRLYTEESAEEDMYRQTIPEIQRTNLANTVLLLKSLGIKDVLKFPFLDPPPLQTLLTSLYELWFNGAIDNFGELTEMGKEMSRFPLQPSLSKILLIAAQNGCSEEMLIIVSMLSVPQVFYRPKGQEKEADAARTRFFIPESDHLTLLNVYSQWKGNKFSSHWCDKHFLVYRSLVRAHEIVRQLSRVMRSNKIPLVSSNANWNVIRKCICAGFTHQAAKVSGLGKYINLRTGMAVELHPTSALFGLGDPPPYIIYHELLLTTKEYMCCTTAVDPFWLMEYGGILYDIKRLKEDQSTNYGLFNSVDPQVEVYKQGEDDLDRKIKASIQKRQSFITKLKEDSRKALTKGKENSPRHVEVKKGPVHIGFKKRRPF